MSSTVSKDPVLKKKLRRLVADFKNKSIVVVGDLMTDRYIRGSVNRLSPEAPVAVVNVTQETIAPGGAGNVVYNLVALGAHVTVIGVVGDDEAGRILISEFNSKGAETEHILTDWQRVTGQKTRVIADRQQIVRYDQETVRPVGSKIEDEVIRRLPQAFSSAQGLILSDYGKGMITPAILKAAISQAKKHSIPVTVDPKIEHFSRYRGVTCITPNLHEAWAGMHRSPKPGNDQIEALGRGIIRKLRGESVLITRGAEGMSLFKANGSILHIPTQAREVFDVTGAGDTVIATLTLALACSAKIEEAAVIANYAAGIVVGKLGTASATAQEVLESLR